MKKITYFSTAKNLSAGLVILLALAIVAWHHSATVRAAAVLSNPPDPEQNSSLLDRVSSRKTTFKVQLSNTARQNLSAKCALAQAALANIKTKDADARNNRKKIYTDLASQLDELISGLNAQTISTTSLGNAQTAFEEDINHYLTDAQEYKTVLNDLTNMDCSSDPDGFQASILAARQLRSQMATDSSTIKGQVSGLVKAINDVKATLGSR